MKYRLISIVLCLVLAVVMAVSMFSVSADTFVEDSDWKYQLPSDNAAEYYIAGYTGSYVTAAIPAVYNGRIVTKIADNAFLNKTGFNHVIIPQTVTEIGTNAFYGCTTLKQVTLPKSVEVLGQNAFYGCTSLGVLNIEKGTQLTSISKNSFCGCTSLTSVTIAQGVERIEDYAFNKCPNLVSVIIPPSVTYISPVAFDANENLVIKSYNGSYALEYAEENNISYISYGDYVEPTVVPVQTETQPTETETETTEYKGKVYLVGDADLDNRISVRDATLIQKSAALVVELDRLQTFLANCDGESGVNIKDATAIQKYAAGFLNIPYVGDEVIV